MAVKQLCDAATLLYTYTHKNRQCSSRLTSLIAGISTTVKDETLAANSVPVRTAILSKRFQNRSMVLGKCATN